MTTLVPFGAGECALDRPERTDWGYHLDHLEEEEEELGEAEHQVLPSRESGRRPSSSGVGGAVPDGNEAVTDGESDNRQAIGMDAPQQSYRRPQRESRKPPTRLRDYVC